jgi:hypothetical protein
LIGGRIAAVGPGNANSELKLINIIKATIYSDKSNVKIPQKTRLATMKRTTQLCEKVANVLDLTQGQKSGERVL